jgi:hypothetical protein
VAFELATTAVLTSVYLVVVSERPVWIDAGLGLVAVVFVAATARKTREEIWTPLATEQRERLRRSSRHMLVGTSGVALLFAIIGRWTGRAEPLFTATMLAALVPFTLWATLQQVLFQFYLLGRLRILIPAAPPFALAAVNGLLFGAVHLPDGELTVLTSVWRCVELALLARPLPRSHRQADVQHAAPTVTRDVLEPRGFGKPRVVEHYVEAAVRLDREIKGRLHGRRCGGIHLDADCTTSGTADLVGNGGGPPAADVADDDVRTFARESCCRRSPDAGSAGGDDGYLTCESSDRTRVAHGTANMPIIARDETGRDLAARNLSVSRGSDDPSSPRPFSVS